MRKRKIILATLTLALIATTGFALNWFRAHQKLGRPGIKAAPTSEGIVMSIELPEKVLDFTSTNVPQSEVVLGYLPKDTSYAQRFYMGEDGFWANANIILMGTDRSSIHKADYCLAGQGWRTVKKETVKIPIGGPEPYEMPVAKWTISRIIENPDGTKREIHGIYSFWFVADGQQTVSNDQRILWFYRDLLTRNVLQRWAYVSYLVACNEGQEDAAFERLKGLIAASVPEFQLPPKMIAHSAVARR
jgi:hypothetical protein